MVSNTLVKLKDPSDKECMNTTGVSKNSMHKTLPLSLDTSHNPNIFSSVFFNGCGRTPTQIPPLYVKDRSYLTSGPCPLSTQRVSTYLCELIYMPSYATPDPGVYIISKLEYVDILKVRIINFKPLFSMLDLYIYLIIRNAYFKNFKI